MDRRGVLRVLALSSLGIAGCNSNGGGRFRKETTTSEQRDEVTLTESVSDVLRVAIGLSLTDETWVVSVSAGNSASAPATAEFTGVAVLDGDAGRITSEPVERTIDAGETQSFDIELAASDDLTYTERTTLRFHGFELRLLADGEPLTAACPSPEHIVATGEGCLYQDPNETYVTVEYGGSWAGSVYADAFSTSVNSADDGAPPGQSLSYIDVGDDVGTVAANIFKTDDGDGELTVSVHHDGSVVASDSATESDDIVHLTATL